MDYLHFVFLLLLLSPFFIYPLFLRFAPAWNSRAEADFSPDSSPWLLLICFKNQESFLRFHVGQYVELCSNFSNLHCVLIDDGSQDETAIYLQSIASEQITVLSFSETRGKNWRLREFMDAFSNGDGIFNADAQAASFQKETGFSGEPVLFFSDGNTGLCVESFSALAEELRFSDVGLAGGRLVYRETKEGEAKYWAFENNLRWRESFFYSQIGVCGAFFALKYRYYVAQNDSFPIDLAFSLECFSKGLRTAFADKALVYESLGDMDIISRKSRTCSRAIFCARHYLPKLLACRHRGWVRFLFSFFFHKLLRWLFPLFLVVWLFTLCFLPPFWVFFSLFFLSLHFVIFPPLYLLKMTYSMCAAFLFFLRGYRILRW